RLLPPSCSSSVAKAMCAAITSSKLAWPADWKALWSSTMSNRYLGIVSILSHGHRLWPSPISRTAPARFDSSAEERPHEQHGHPGEGDRQQPEPAPDARPADRARVVARRCG